MADLHLEWFVLAAFAGIIVWAVLNDCLSYRIPNAASIALVLLYPAWLAVAWPASDPWLTIAMHVGIGVGMLVVGFVLYMLRAFGAGDAKLLAAVALWAGPAEILNLVLVTAVTGGVLSLVILLSRRMAETFALHYRARALVTLFSRGAAASEPPGADRPLSGADAKPDGPGNGRSGHTTFERPIPYGVAIGAGAALVAYGLLTTFGAA